MRLFLDSTTRIFRGQAPEGAGTLGPPLTVGTIEFEVSDDDWNAIYYPAFAASVASGQDLVIDTVGGTSLVAHTPTAQEVAQSALITFANIASPTTSDVATALKALVTGGGTSLLPVGAWGVVVWGTDAWQG